MARDLQRALVLGSFLVLDIALVVALIVARRQGSSVAGSLTTTFDGAVAATLAALTYYVHRG